MSLDFRQLGVLEQQKWPKTSFFAVNSVFSERACELKVKFISPPGRGVIDRAEFDCHFFKHASSILLAIQANLVRAWQEPAQRPLHCSSKCFTDFRHPSAQTSW